MLYRGRRYWVFEVSSDKPFEGQEDFYDIVFWDGLYGAVITGGSTGIDGVIRGSVQYGQGGIDVSGKTVKEFVDDCVNTCAWINKEVSKGIRMEQKPFYNGRFIKILRGHTLTPPRAGLHVYKKDTNSLIGTVNSRDGIAWDGNISVGKIEIPITQWLLVATQLPRHGTRPRSRSSSTPNGRGGHLRSTQTWFCQFQSWSPPRCRHLQIA